MERFSRRIRRAISPRVAARILCPCIFPCVLQVGVIDDRRIPSTASSRYTGSPGNESFVRVDRDAVWLIPATFEASHLNPQALEARGHALRLLSSALAVAFDQCSCSGKA